MSEQDEYHYDFSNAARQSDAAVDMNMERFRKFLKRVRELEFTHGLKLTMPIHDEILLEFPEGTTDEQQKKIREELFCILTDRT